MMTIPVSTVPDADDGALPGAPDWRAFAAAILTTLESRPQTWAFTEIVPLASMRTISAAPTTETDAADATPATPEAQQAEGLDDTETME